MAQSNLTISVGIDTAKLRADAAIVKAELREVTKEVTRAADEARKTGDTSQLQAQTARQDALIQQYRILTQQIAAAGRAHADAAPGVAALDARFADFTTRLRGVGTALSEVGDRVFPHFREVIALSLAGAAAAFVKLSTDAARATDELQDSAEAIGISVNKLLSFRLAAAREGADPGVAVQGLERFARSFGAAVLEADKAVGQLGGNFVVLNGQAQAAGSAVAIARGNVSTLATAGKAAADGLASVGGTLGQQVNLIRGGVRPILDTSDAFKTLGIDVRQFSRDEHGVLDAFQAVSTAIDRQGRSAERATILAQIFGRNWATQVELLTNLRDRLKEADKAIEDFGIQVDETEKTQARALLASLGTLTTVAGRIRTILGNIAGTALVPLFEGLTKTLGENQAALREWAQSVATAMIPIARDLVVVLRDGLGGKFETQAITQATQVLRALGAVIAEIVAALRGLISVLDLVAVYFNAAFGTEFSGTGLLVLGIILRITGAFRLLGAVLGALTGGIGVLIGLFRGLGAAGGIAAGLAAGGGWAVLARFLGPAGLLAVGILWAIGKFKELGDAGKEAADKASEAADKARGAAAVLRGVTARAPVSPEAAAAQREARMPTVEARAPAGETDAQYFARTGFHYGDRAGQVQDPAARARIQAENETSRQARIAAAQPPSAVPARPGSVAITTPQVEITQTTGGRGLPDRQDPSQQTPIKDLLTEIRRELAPEAVAPLTPIGERGRRVEQTEVTPPVQDRGREREPQAPQIDFQPLIDQIKALGDLLPSIVTSVGESIGSLAGASKTATDAVAQLSAGTSELATDATRAAQVLADAIAAAEASADVTPFASGGLVRGPGTATSDSIPAWLSAGEFVVNAASVRRLGLDAMHRINSFAHGGIVGPLESPAAAAGAPSAAGGPNYARARDGHPAGFLEALRGLHFSRGGLASALSAGRSFSSSLVREIGNFAVGGLVMPPIRFADGGMVAAGASAGRPVHLHLGAQSFALSGPAGVVDALVTAAHGQQMRSAGVKPSWFAGRPGGR